MRRWHGEWATRRKALMTFANAHRGEPIYERAKDLMTAVNRQVAAGQYFVWTNFNKAAAGESAFPDADARTTEAEAAADALLDAL